MAMDEIRIRMQGKKDANKNDYYVAVTDLPVMIDLSNTVFVLFPDEEDGGRFGGDLVVRKYRGEMRPPPKPSRRVRRERPSTDSSEKKDG